MTTMIVYFNQDYVASSHAFDTTRKSALIAESLVREPLAGVTIESPEPLTDDLFMLAHNPDYVEAVRTGQPLGLAQSNGFSWDPNMFRMVSASNGGVVAAAYQALADGVSGTLSSGLHHAHRERGGGFCTFNGLAIAALELIRTGAVKRVLIIDFDAHYGDGTASIIAGNDQIRMIDVSTGWSVKNYLDECQKALETVLGEDFGLVIYNAGMDPHEDCRIGGCPGVTEQTLSERENLVFGLCRQRSWPVAFTLAGGYSGGKLTNERLVNLHRLTIAEACKVL
jgi:acetoin utilization deacetylase AcuC-like enzyme